MVFKADPVEDVEYQKNLMLLVQIEGEEVVIDQVVEVMVGTREERLVVLVVDKVVVMVMVREEEVVVVEEVVAEVAEEGAMVEWAGVVEEVGVVVEVVVVMMTMMKIMVCLNIRIGGGSDCKTLQSNPFKQTILPGSQQAKWTMTVSIAMLCCFLVRIRHSVA